MFDDAIAEAVDERSDRISCEKVNARQSSLSGKQKMSKFKEAVEVMKRIEATEGTKEGKMLVKGTIIMEGEDTIHSSLDNTTTVSISRCLFPFTDICSNLIRTVDPSDNVEFIKVNFSNRDVHSEILMAPDGDFQAIVLQEHPIRDLRKRSLKEQKNPKGYRHVQQNLFFPSLDDSDTPEK